MLSTLRAEVFFLLTTCLLTTATVNAAGKGQGAIVIRDKAPVYVHSTGEKTENIGDRGDAVGGVTTMGLHEEYLFEKENGRVHVVYYVPNKEGKGLVRTAWMDPADLATFLYDCGCGNLKGKECAPYVMSGFKYKWNPCFEEARDKKLEELKTKWAETPPAGSAAQGTAGSVVPKPPAEKPLTNDDVIALIKAGLGDDLTITKISQAPSEALDVSTEGLVALKKSGANKPIIDAIMKRVAARK